MDGVKEGVREGATRTLANEQVESAPKWKGQTSKQGRLLRLPHAVHYAKPSAGTSVVDALPQGDS